MSDFLTRLVTATYGAAPVMQPRPVAQYEPVTTTLPVWPQDAEATPSVALDEMTGSTAPANPAGAPGVSMTPLSMPSDSTGRSTLSAPARTPAPQERRHDALAPQSAARLDALSGRPARAAHHTHEVEAERAALAISARTSPASPPLTANWQPTDLPVAPAPLSTHPYDVPSNPEPLHAPVVPLPTTILPASAASQRAEARTPVLAAQRTPAATPLAPASLAVQRAALAAESAGETDDAHSAQGAAQRLAQSPGRSMPDPALRPPVAPSEESTAPAPVVRVTIGRIVIKAEPASPARTATAPARRPATPTLSLDQYLQGRNGGGA